MSDGEALFVTAMQELPTATPTVAMVKAKMLALGPSFDETTYGCTSFRDFLAKLKHQAKTLGRSGHDIILSLIEN